MKKIEKFFLNFYEVIFREKPSEKVNIFLRDFSRVTIGFGLYIFFGFCFQILSGRILGPTEYGKYVLVQSIATFLIIPMSLGISTAVIKYNAEISDFSKQSKVISATFLLITLLSMISLAFFLLFSKAISGLLGVSVSFLILSIMFALFYNLYLLVTSVFRSLHKNKEFSFFQATYGFLGFIFLSFFILNKNFSFKGAVYGTYAAYLVVFFIALVMLRKYIKFNFDYFWLKKLILYGVYATIAAISSALLFNFSKIIINKFLSVTDVGIYSAYFFSSVGMATILLSSFNVVFFSTASKYQGKYNIFKKINKIIPFFMFVGTIIFYILALIILKFYGKKYEINYFLAFEFVVASILVTCYGLYDWLFASDEFGIKFGSFVNVLLAIINVFALYYLVPFLGLQGCAISLVITYTVGILIYMIKGQTFIANK